LLESSKLLLIVEYKLYLLIVFITILVSVLAHEICSSRANVFPLVLLCEVIQIFLNDLPFLRFQSYLLSLELVDLQFARHFSHDIEFARFFADYIDIDRIRENLLRLKSKCEVENWVDVVLFLVTILFKVELQNFVHLEVSRAWHFLRISCQVEMNWMLLELTQVSQFVRR